MKSLILLLILAFYLPAHAQMSCMSLFNFTRPSEEQINTAIYELAQLIKYKHAKDPATRLFAKNETEKKFSELMQIMDRSEIKSRLLAVEITNTSRQQNREKDFLRESGKKLLEDLALVQEYLKEFNFKDIHSKNSANATPIDLASHQNRVDVVEALIKLGVDINTLNLEGLSPLLSAAKYGRPEMVEMLLKYNPDLNIRCREEDRTPLLWAIWHIYENNIADQLIQHGVDINVRDKAGNTPLSVILLNRKKHITEYIIKHTKDIDALNSMFLRYASSPGIRPYLELLIKSGADVNAIDKKGHSALWNAVRYSDSNTVKLLIELGANVNFKGPNNQSVLQLAQQSKEFIIIRMLKEAGAVE